MTSTFLLTELNNLVSEAKRKNTELRNAAEKSLNELKGLIVTSEQQLANGDLSRRPIFVDPFIIACDTHSTKFAGSGIACLQRLIVSGGLPKSKLRDALNAFNSCADLGLEIQLKILQALPSLLQNYAAELEGDLLGGALQLCASLQAAKTATVSGVAAATLQTLVTTVFEKVSKEDSESSHETAKIEVPGDDGPIQLKPAAFDAYRVLRDLALAADQRSTKFISFSALPPQASLELIWSSLDSNPELFDAHEELLSIIGANVFPLIVRALSEKLPFATTVRSLRLFDLILDRYMSRFPGDCEVALNLCTQSLEPDYAPMWKRAIVLEILKGFFATGSLVIEAFTLFDSRKSGRPIVQDMLSAFVRLSTEKPAAIGLSQQSTQPTGPTSPGPTATDQATLEAAGGMAGVISSAFGVAESNVAGVSTQWSLPKTPCIDQLDKHDPPTLPETYPCALVLECLNGLSDTLARVVLPLTVQHERSRAKSANGSHEKPDGLKRSTSFRTRTVPLNPLEKQDAPYHDRIRMVAGIVDGCWPAVLATSSTFLNAALEDQYFRNLIKAYQRFAQVAGLLRLNTPRDALMTTLAKAAVPPHVLNAATSEPVRSPVAESPRIYSNPKSLLSVDSLASQTSSLSIDNHRRNSLEQVRPMLTVRNLLCLRALLNLAIALGPTLGPSFAVIVSALKQADIVLSNTTPQKLSRQSLFASRVDTDHPTLVQAFSNEVAAVEAAASRLLESTSDYPNEAFANVLDTFCKLLQGRNHATSSPTSPQPGTRPSSPKIPGRTFSGLPGISFIITLQPQDYHFVIPKLGNLAELNISRFTGDEPTESGWYKIVDELLSISRNNGVPRDARRNATNVLVKLAEASIADVQREDTPARAKVQERALRPLLQLIDQIYLEDGELTTTDMQVQSQVLEALRAILERGGDSLVAGWDVVIAIISTAFEHDGSTFRHAKAGIDWQTISADFVSPTIGRIAFIAIQLLCSDFMDSIPLAEAPSLIELLHRFMCQTEDLNAGLTAVTMAWNVADYLFDKCGQDDLNKFVNDAADFDDLANDLKPLLLESRPAQWLQLLCRLRDVASRNPAEIRNAAFQTLCNVFKSRGEEFPGHAWDLLLRSTLLHVSRSDSYLYMQENANDEDGGSTPATPDVEMSQAIIAGTSGIVAQYLRLIEQVKHLPSLWETFLGMLERYLDVEDYTLSAAVYSSLARVLSGINPQATSWKGPVYRTTAFWLKRFPHFNEATPDRKKSNQDGFLAYAEAANELYRLTSNDLSTSQTRTMIDNLYHCLLTSDGPLYGADANALSPLQAKVLSIFRKMRLDRPSVPACLVTVAAKLATLHLDSAPMAEASKQHPTFVALGHESIKWLQDLVVPQLGEPEFMESDALISAVHSLRCLIEAKYAFRVDYKGRSLWRGATSTAVTLAKPIVERMQQRKTEDSIRRQLWSELLAIAGSIVRANGMHLATDWQKLYDDMLADIESFEALRAVIMPHLASSGLSFESLNEYAIALFEASIIHETEPGESPGLEHSPLKDIGKIRRGRVKEVPYSRREEMAYLCWKELIALSSAHSDTKTPVFDLSRAAAPLLILRLAIPVRAYIADQPLRGKMPQPLWEQEELLFSFETVRNLRLVPNVLGVSGGDSSSERAHLRYLYPLLVQALKISQHRHSGSAEVFESLQETLTGIDIFPS